MGNKKGREKRNTKSASTGSPSSPTKSRFNFSLNAHKATVIVGVLSLAGVLTASFLASSGSVAVAFISNWDKLQGSQTTQPDVTEDLLTYNEQRMTLVEGAFDQALGHLQEAEKEVIGAEAEALKDAAASIKEKKAAAQRQYGKVRRAIKDKKLVQAEMGKTELNTTIIEAQREYDAAASRRSIRGEGVVKLRPERATGIMILPQMRFPCLMPKGSFSSKRRLLPKPTM